MTLLEKLNIFFSIDEIHDKQFTNRVNQPILDLSYKITPYENHVTWVNSRLSKINYDLTNEDFLNYVKSNIIKNLTYKLSRITNDVQYKIQCNSKKCEVVWDFIDTHNMISDILNTGKTRLSFIVKPYKKNWIWRNTYSTPYRFVINIHKDYVVIESYDPDTRVQPVIATTDTLHDIDSVIITMMDVIALRVKP